MELALDIEAEVADSVITGLDVSAFERDDLVNVILQRSEVLWDQPKPGAVIRSWRAGDMGPINAAVDRLGEDIARRAAAVIHAEFRSLEPVLSQSSPKIIADIGCGYAFFDLFAARYFNCDLVLIDLEQNEHRHFGFQEEGAAYSSLSVARQMLLDNGVEDAAIRLLNPNQEDPASCRDIDLAFSFLSCGFHYPVSSYIPFFEKSVADEGSIILDLRSKTAQAQQKAVSHIGVIEHLPARGKSTRIHLKKTVGAR
ncbi:MAG: class I SAM-dependent methyltransferase [Marinosulfonomonas sp.]|nr:class I SAM-dependent methyltransferase [Marinosulfonomonas sp.]